MKNKGLLPDTCAWIDYFRPGVTGLGQALARALANNGVYICGPIIYELIQGARSEQERTVLIDAFGALSYLEMNKMLWFKAGELSATVRKAGKTIPFSDIVIAALALEHNLAVLTVDEHFQHIPGLAIQAIE